MATHYDRIPDYMERFGSITTYEAFIDLGETKLTTRISDLRKRGVKIAQKEEIGENRYGQTVRYMRYSLPKEESGRPWKASPTEDRERANVPGRMIGV